MLYKAMMSVDCQDHMGHVHTHVGKMECFHIQSDGTYTKH